MLRKIQQRFSLHWQAFVSSLKVIWQKPLGSLITVSVIAIAFAFPVLLGVCADNLRQLTTGWQHNGHISVYLKPNITDEAQTKAMQMVLATEGVKQATLKTATQGLSELTQQEGMQDIMQYLPENPLPAVITVVPAISINAPAKLDLLARQLETIASVDRVKSDIDWIRRLHEILHFATGVAQALFILFACAVLFIIGNTLRLTIQNRQEEIQILKLVGATDPYIIRPFLYSGIFYSFSGAVVAVCIVNLLVLSLSSSMNRLLVSYQMHASVVGLSLRASLLLALLAVIIGWLGACLSVRRQLASIEPCS